MTDGLTVLVVAWCAVLGLVVGSFLNVVVYRVPRDQSVVRPASRCPVCGHRVRARDNVPVLSWLLLRGRCRDCGTRISARYPLVELGTATAFALVALRFGASWELPAFLYLAAVSIALALIDIDVRRLPNAIVYPSYPVGVALLTLAAAGTGDWGALGRAALGAVALFVFYVVLVVVHPRGMGMGDVKLSGVLGLHLGWLGWSAVVVGGFLGFLVGGLYGVALLASRRAGRRSMIPFGPFMLVGAWLAVVVAQPVTDWYLGAVLGL